jgi:hypothetical protein
MSPNRDSSRGCELLELAAELVDLFGDLDQSGVDPGKRAHQDAVYLGLGPSQWLPAGCGPQDRWVARNCVGGQLSHACFEICHAPILASAS